MPGGPAGHAASLSLRPGLAIRRSTILLVVSRTHVADARGEKSHIPQSNFVAPVPLASVCWMEPGAPVTRHLPMLSSAPLVIGPRPSSFEAQT